jgi:3'(2'), 5'-bisphosphate nucleotidase
VDLESLWTTLDNRLLPVLLGYRRRLPTLDVTTKRDRTLLSEADIAVQALIVDSIVEIFPESGFVAEEDDERLLPRHGSPMWVIDPIDGTSEFVNPSGREYCSVVCQLDEGTPTGAYVLAPEIGVGESSVSVHWSGLVTVNGSDATPLPKRGLPARASVTRSNEVPARFYETHLARIGCAMKVRTTSQTLDMVRSTIDLTIWTDAPDEQFDIFYRPRQKVWDGIAGIGLAMAMGRTARNGAGEIPIPLTPAFLARIEPTFDETIAGDPDCVGWFLNLLMTMDTGSG